jgi:hypothetical protein
VGGVTRERKKLYNEKFHNVYASHNNIRRELNGGGGVKNA